ncbi:hypothetical protein CRG98_041054 [Punica granatum]|uniref:Uncharacterized protein n=1 Tax=Punica granatum TaxID=22663 RepID=A0A2I0I3T5_PUNGR|nr:hypothetical protein CRG98_041054 [Punica granatum]
MPWPPSTAYFSAIVEVGHFPRRLSELDETGKVSLHPSLKFNGGLRRSSPLPVVAEERGKIAIRAEATSTVQQEIYRTVRPGGKGEEGEESGSELEPELGRASGLGSVKIVDEIEFFMGDFRDSLRFWTGAIWFGLILKRIWFVHGRERASTRRYVGENVYSQTMRVNL